MYMKFNADLLLFSLNGAGIEIQEYLVWKKKEISDCSFIPRTYCCVGMKSAINII